MKDKNKDVRTPRERLGDFQFCSDAIKRARPFAIKKDSRRDYLEGVYLEGDRAIATDGKRLASVRAVCRDIDYPKEPVIVVVRGKMPRHATIATFMFVDDYSGLVRFKHCPSDDALFRVVDKPFPNYRQVIPADANDAKKRFHFNPQYLAALAPVFGDQVVIEGNNSRSPFLITPGNRTASSDRLGGDFVVVMPLRVDGWGEDE